MRSLILETDFGIAGSGFPFIAKLKIKGNHQDIEVFDLFFRKNIVKVNSNCNDPESESHNWINPQFLETKFIVNSRDIEPVSEILKIICNRYFTKLKFHLKFYPAIKQVSKAEYDEYQKQIMEKLR